ncbi:MAG: PepSY domain-containing protein [Blastocatellia bacterium]
MKFPTLNRKVHYWVSIFVAAPVLIIIGTGLLLQMKKQLRWVQPPEQRGEGRDMEITFPQILAICRNVPEAQVQSWEDINRLDVRPSRGMIKVWAKNNWEVQLDSRSGKVLQVAYRRSDLIEAIHDGSWFHESAKLTIFLPAGITLLLLWLTGIYLFFLPIFTRRRQRAKLTKQAHAF